MTIRVMVVDDDVPTRVGVRTILSSDPDIEVVGEAATATEALDLVAAVPVDVVLMDVQLPDLNGIAATQLITDPTRVGRAPRVIVLTTFNYDEYAYRSLLAGASGFMLKRAPAEELIDAVRAVADGGSLPMAERTHALISAFVTPPRVPPDGEGTTALTSRESEVLLLIARGLSNTEIAERLELSVETVKTHVKRIYVKCGARDRAQAVIFAYENGMVPRTE